MISRLFGKAAPGSGVGNLLRGMVAASAAVTLASAQSTTVVISQVYGAGGNSGATYNADFIELLNISSAPVSLDGMSLQYASNTGAFSSVYALSGTIQPGKYFLVAMAAGSNGAALPVTADLTGTLGLGANNGKVVLASQTTALGALGSATGATIVDLVGFGTATLFEGSAAAPAPSTTNSIFRANNGATDTNQNGTDFSAALVAPRNSGSPGLPVGPDTTPPALAAAAPLIPANGEPAAPVDSILTIKFTESVVPVTGGTISLYKVGDVTPVEILDVKDLFGVEINANTVKAYLSAPLTVSTNYYVLISAGAFEDAAGNDFGGITATTGPNAWAFTSAPPDQIGPVATTFVPAAGSTTVAEYGIPLSANVLFNELIDVASATGTITLRDGTTDAVLETLAVDEILIGGAGNQLFLNFDHEPVPATTYKIRVGAGALTDLLGNPNLEFEWTFTAKPEPPSASLTSAGPYTQDFSTFGPASSDTATTSAPVLPLGWSLDGLVTVFPADTTGPPTPQRPWGAGFSAGLRGVLGENVLGYQHTGSTVNPPAVTNFKKVLTLRNETGSTINNLVISYTGKVNRTGEGRSPIYTVTVDGIEFPGLQYSTESGAEANIISAATGLNIPAGEIFQIKWISDRGLPGGSSKQIGLTNVSVGVGTGNFPPALVGPSHQLWELSDTGTSVSTNITSDNGSPVTGRGIVFSPTTVSSNPVIGGSGVIQVADGTPATGIFTSMLTGLTPATAYSVKAYAINANGTTYSPAISITTLPAPPSFTGTYSQPFDNYTGIWPTGWTAVSLGGIQSFVNLAWTGGATNGGFYGGLSDPGLLGYLHTGASGDLETELTMVNGTSSTLTQLFVSYLGRAGNPDATRFPVWTVYVNGVEVPALAYSTEPGTDNTVGTLVTGLSIAPGARFTIKWVSNRGEGGGGSRKIGIGEVLVALDAPPAGGFASWLDTNAPSGTLAGDHDGDGVPNGVEYFFGLTGNSFTANPQLANGKITWPTAGVTDLTYKVQTSTTLAADGWSTVAAGQLDTSVAGFISYTPPAPTTGAPKLFIRFVVETIPN